MDIKDWNQQGMQGGALQGRSYEAYATPRSDNAITYMRQRRKELVLKLQALAGLQSELANIDKALAALGDEP